MVTTRANSRESTPAASVRGARTTTRRSTTTPATDLGTPSSRARTRRAAPAAARTGQTSHAYGAGSQAIASRVASRNLQGFSSALQDELDDQDEIAADPEPRPEPSTLLPPIAEDDRRSSSREATPASKISSSSSTSPTALLGVDGGKSFSNQREDGLRHVQANFRDIPQPAVRDDAPQRQQGPTPLERFTIVAQEIASGAKVFFLDYWKLLLGLLLALTFGSLLAAYGIPTLDRILPSRPIHIPKYPPSGPSVVTSYISAQSDPAISNRLRHLESRVTFLEDELSRSKSDGTLLNAPFNHLSASIGATILPGYTSPTKRTASILLSPLAKLWTPPGMKGPLTALMSWSEPGQCWCTPADSASLGVRASYPIRPNGVTIEHIVPDDIKDSGHDLSTAPSLVEIWARAGESDPTVAGACMGKAPGNGFNCLGRMDLGRYGTRADIRSHTVELFSDVVAQDFVFVVLENRGSVGATCLYRVQMHGQKEES